jgi:hypothetical protein
LCLGINENSFRKMSMENKTKPRRRKPLSVCRVTRCACVKGLESPGAYNTRHALKRTPEFIPLLQKSPSSTSALSHVMQLCRIAARKSSVSTCKKLYGIKLQNFKVSKFKRREGNGKGCKKKKKKGKERKGKERKLAFMSLSNCSSLGGWPLNLHVVSLAGAPPSR